MGSSEHPPPIWRCDVSTAVQKTPLRVVLKEKPNLPVKLVEAPLVTNTRSTNIVLEEASEFVTKERGTNPVGNTNSAKCELEETPADRRQKTISDASYAQACTAIEQAMLASSLECKPCGAASDVKINYCHACMP